MAFRIVSDNFGEYIKSTLVEAAYLAAKMADQGGRNVRVYDAEGREIDLRGAPPPEGWSGEPFYR
jgi:hypothetical protein